MSKSIKATVLADLLDFVGRRGYSLSPEAEAIFVGVEEIGSSRNCTVLLEVFAAGAVQASKSFCTVLNKCGFEPERILKAFLATIERGQGDDEGYLQGDMYSQSEGRGQIARTAVLDLAFVHADIEQVTCVQWRHVILAMLDYHDDEFPPSDNGGWTDMKLNTTYNTLAHVTGKYSADLWVRFDTLREALSENVSVSEELAAEPIMVPGTLIHGAHFSFAVIRPLGRGGLGRTFAVRSASGSGNGVFVAKVLSDHRFEITERVLVRFRREIDVQSQVRHRNVIGVVDVCDDHGMVIPVIEYAAGGDLQRKIGRLEAPLDAERALAWMRDAARGVAHLHGLGIVHRDLSPKNLLIRADGSLAVADFGIARRLDDETITHEADRMGSLIYISAQQRDNPHDATFADDVYSLGQVFFFMATGRKPHGIRGSVRTFRADFPVEMDSLVESMRANFRAERPSASEVEMRIDHFLDRADEGK